MLRSQDSTQTLQEDGWVAIFDQGETKNKERDPKNRASAKGFKPRFRQDRSIGPKDRSFALAKNHFFFLINTIKEKPYKKTLIKTFSRKNI